MKKPNVRHSLVHRLRAPIRRVDDKGSPDVGDLTEKIHAIGEALAYIIEKKKLKRDTKKAKRGA